MGQRIHHSSDHLGALRRRYPPYGAPARFPTCVLRISPPQRHLLCPFHPILSRRPPSPSLQAADVSADYAFNGVVMFCILYFTLEIVLSSACKPGYFLSFFFYLDVLATLSMLLDIHEARSMSIAACPVFTRCDWHRLFVPGGATQISSLTRMRHHPLHLRRS